jgi:hypothetical protein
MAPNFLLVEPVDKLALDLLQPLLLAASKAFDLLAKKKITKKKKNYKKKKITKKKITKSV